MTDAQPRIARSARKVHMNLLTILLIVVVVILLFGGFGYSRRGR